jgi:hypothetical protein
MYHYLVFETNNNLLTDNIGNYTVFNIPMYINKYNWKNYSKLEYYFNEILFDVKNILFLSDVFENVNIYTIDKMEHILSRNDYTVIHYLTEEFEFSFIEQYNKPKKLYNYSEIINFYKSYKSCNNNKIFNDNFSYGEFNGNLLDVNDNFII